MKNLGNLEACLIITLLVVGCCCIRIKPKQLTTTSRRIRWSFDLYGDTYSTPTTAAINNQYVTVQPERNGWLHALKTTDGTLLWSTKLTSFPQSSKGAYCNSQPSCDRNCNTLIVCNQVSAQVFGINATNGQWIWTRALDTARSIISSSAEVHNGIAYVGLDLNEKNEPGNVPLRGSIYALDVSNGEVIWKFQTVPNNHYGGAVRSSLVVDENLQTLFAFVGHNTIVPNRVLQCSDADISQAQSCQDPDNYAGSIIALDLYDGTLKWTRRVMNNYWKNQNHLIDSSQIVSLSSTTIGMECFSDGEFCVLDRETGSMAWRSKVFRNSGKANIFSDVNTAAAYYVYKTSDLACVRGHIGAIEKTSGRLLWKTCAAVTPQSVIELPGNNTILTIAADGIMSVDASSGVLASKRLIVGRANMMTACPDGTILSDICSNSARNKKICLYDVDIIPNAQRNAVAPPTTHIVHPALNNEGIVVFVPDVLTVRVGDTISWTRIHRHFIYQAVDADSLQELNGGVNSAPKGPATFNVTITRQMLPRGKNELYFRCGVHSTMIVKAIVFGSPNKHTQTGTQCPYSGDTSSVFNMRYFIDELPIPKVATPFRTLHNVHEYRINITDFYHSFHSDIPPVLVRGYGSQYPGPTIVNYRYVKTRVHWENKLLANSTFMNVETIPAGLTTNRIVTHLHGHDSDQHSDGLPEDTVDPGETFTTNYDNEQPPCFLWYHDHSLGNTRSQVYAGLAGIYLIKEPALESRLNLPEGEYDIPLFLQDKIIAKTADGSYIQYYPYEWQMTFYGQIVIVNGRVWPYKQVKTRKYRLRILNGCNQRFLRLRFSNNMTFTIIASDQGYHSQPVYNVDQVVLSPAERVEILVDFCDYAGEDIILLNDAPTPYPYGSKVDPCHQGRLMEFVVDENDGDESTCAMWDEQVHLHEAPVHAINSLMPSDAIKTRDVVLIQDFQISDMPVQGTRFPNGTIKHFMYEDPPTEIVKAGSTEIWRIFNFAPETHPIHTHTSAFKVLHRQKFNATLLKENGKNLQLIGPATMPDVFETGPKDVVQAPPSEVTTVLVKFARKVGTFLWHCHIAEHEDNMMMRPLVLA
ncbi:spore coat protein A [Acrasis kona]|uniref:Spore coat protein A n=1 Tax=Acrasis kona TaxID=1008807 RepID=A0AAW2YPR7_9EUKA